MLRLPGPVVTVSRDVAGGTLPWRRSYGPWSPDNARSRDNARQCVLYGNFDQDRPNHAITISIMTTGRVGELIFVYCYFISDHIRECMLVYQCYTVGVNKVVYECMFCIVKEDHKLVRGPTIKTGGATQGISLEKEKSFFVIIN